MPIAVDKKSPVAAQLLTWSGLQLAVRPVADGDEEALFALFATLSREDMRFRFLSAVSGLSDAMLDIMVHVDHAATEHLLAFADDGTLYASAMIALDADGKAAEVAIAVAGDHRGQGIGWALLEHCAEVMRARGVAVIRTIEAADNLAAIRLERERGFSARPVTGDSSLTLLELALA